MRSPYIHALKASAGAGKTYQLTMRFLSLLSTMRPSSESLRQIVAITFTNRAAAEMKDRVILTLKKIALHTEEGARLSEQTGLPSSEAAAWLDVILHHFDDFHVRTIDSLIYTMVGALALEMGLPPELEVDFDRNTVVDRCVDRLLAATRWHNHNDDLRSLFDNLLDTYLNIEEASSMWVEPKIRARLKELYDSTQIPSAPGTRPDLSTARHRFQQAAQAMGALIRKCGLESAVKKGTCKLEYIEDPLLHVNKAMFLKDSAEDLVTAHPTTDPTIVGRLNEVFYELKAARENYLHCTARARLYAYMLVVNRLRKEINSLSQREGVIIGGDWLALTHDYFAQHGATGSFAFLKLGGLVRHFLIDEFQDTSLLQWQVLVPLIDETLSRGGSLFYVGDVKQAIYGWRGGDWQLFGKVVATDFVSVSGEARSLKALDTNYRSLPKIVRFNNAIYGLLADTEFASRLAGIILPRYTASDTKHELARLLIENFHDVRQKAVDDLAQSESPGIVEVIPFVAPPEELRHEVRQRLVEEVRHVHNREPTGIAVLVRRNHDAEDIALWLMAEGIPVVTENSLRLKSSALVKGVASFLRFLEYPLDDMAFWGALASPLYRGLSGVPQAPLEDFIREGHWHSPLYKTFEERFPDLSERFVRPLLARVGFLTPYDLTREVIERFDLLNRFSRDDVFIYRFLELIFHTETRGHRSLSHFLQFWDEGGADEQIGLPDKVHAVRIVTIHKAKGLEFPVVFIPFTNWRLQPPSVAVSEDGALVSLTRPLPQELEAVRSSLMINEVLETLNLLYVATTRAQEELHVYVTCTPKGTGIDTGNVAAWLREMAIHGGYLPV